jgi:hypothetical protein
MARGASIYTAMPQSLPMSPPAVALDRPRCSSTPAGGALHSASPHFSPCIQCKEQRGAPVRERPIRTIDPHQCPTIAPFGTPHGGLARCAATKQGSPKSDFKVTLASPLLRTARRMSESRGHVLWSAAPPEERRRHRSRFEASPKRGRNNNLFLRAPVATRQKRAARERSDLCITPKRGDARKRAPGAFGAKK